MTSTATPYDPILYKGSRPSARTTPRKRFSKLLLTVVFVGLVYTVIQNLGGAVAPLFKHYEVYDYTVSSFSNACEQPKPVAKPSNYSSLYSSPEFRMASAKRLSAAIKIPTMSYDDMGPVDEDPRWAPFTEFHAYLRKTFPAIHTEFNLTLVGGLSLVYTKKGSVTTLKPLLLAAHQDVVPSVTSLDKWKYPPFSGTIDSEWIYGRGASDCKNNLIGIMTAVEHLLTSGWTPERTLILAFGQDEEIGGSRGAYSIGKHLETIYGKFGIEMIVDEGGMGVDTFYGTDFALPGVTEKGYINTIIEVEMLGGHSSVPSKHTTIGILSKIVSNIEDAEVFKPHLEKSSPIWGHFSCIAKHGKKSKVPSWIKKAVLSKNPDLDSIAEKFAQTAPANRYVVQTSKAATIFHAGLKVNALAESATVTFNSRIDIYSSTEEVKKTFLSLVKPIAEKYSLQVNGESVSNKELPSLGNITVSWSDGDGASPISPFNAEDAGWTIFSKAVQASFGENVISSPSAMTGNTDTRRYLNLSHNIYRWSPARVGTRLNAHTVDEKIMIDSHTDGIRFYTELIIQAES